jgi:hypothetical protein
MNYISYQYPITTIVDKKIYHIKHHPMYVINRLLNHQLNTIEGYLKAFKLKFPNKYLCPIYIHENILLIPIYGFKAKENLFINYFEILSVNKSDYQTQFIFKNKDVLLVQKDYRNIILQIRFIEEKLLNPKTFSYRELI